MIKVDFRVAAVISPAAAVIAVFGPIILRDPDTYDDPLWFTLLASGFVLAYGYAVAFVLAWPTLVVCRRLGCSGVATHALAGALAAAAPLWLVSGFPGRLDRWWPYSLAGVVGGVLFWTLGRVRPRSERERLRTATEPPR